MSNMTKATQAAEQIVHNLEIFRPNCAPDSFVEEATPYILAALDAATERANRPWLVTMALDGERFDERADNRRHRPAAREGEEKNMSFSSTDLANLQARKDGKRIQKSGRTHTELVNACLNLLKLYHVFAWKNNTGTLPATYKGKTRYVTFGEPGSPDILGIWRGKPLGVECKVGPDKLRDVQVDFHARFRENYGVILVVRDNVDDLLAFLTAPANSPNGRT